MNLVVVGAQWGDEGKGKIVDFLSENADFVVRYSGGANAGHTVVIGEKTYKLHLIPSGILSQDKIVILGNGMVIDPESLFEELNTIGEQGIEWSGRVLISERAHVVLPRFKRMDVEIDKKRAKPIGTTGRGIGITYSLKASRDSYRFVDILDSSVFNTMEDEDKKFLEKYIPKLEPMIKDTSLILHENRDKNILFEGAQGALLDIDLGTFPYVSSGLSSASGASQGSGLGPLDINGITGVFKAYTTRVGNGPFPTEFREDRDGDLGSRIREIGREYGVTTGRPRRCGYLDVVALKYTCRTNSMNSLSLTHLDVYDGMEEIKAAIAYRYGGKKIENFPASNEVLFKAEPVLKSFKGWKKSITHCRTYEELPLEARDYISFIEDQTGVPVNIISVGYRREETIVREDPWTRS